MRGEAPPTPGSWGPSSTWPPLTPAPTRMTVYPTAYPTMVLVPPATSTPLTWPPALLCICLLLHVVPTSMLPAFSAFLWSLCLLQSLLSPHSPHYCYLPLLLPLQLLLHGQAEAWAGARATLCSVPQDGMGLELWWTVSIGEGRGQLLWFQLWLRARVKAAGAFRLELKSKTRSFSPHLLNGAGILFWIWINTVYRFFLKGRVTQISNKL